MMHKEISDRLVVLRLLLGGLTILMVWLTIDFYHRIQDLGVIFSFSAHMYWLLFGLLLVCAILFVAFVLTWTRYRKMVAIFGAYDHRTFPKIKAINRNDFTAFNWAIFYRSTFFIQGEFWSSIDPMVSHELGLLLLR